MSIVLTRIDTRLIHGQVLEAWVPYAHADCLVVANDAVTENPLKKMMMEASVPSRIRVEIGTVEEIVRHFAAGDFNDRKTLLLFATTGDALVAHQHGLLFSQLNLGNLHAGEGKQRMSCTLYLGSDDIDNLTRLEDEGVTISARCIPADFDRPWRKLIPAKKD
ncbi:MAG TPA: PTS sugar transporter subunit IIB [Geopsychrobacteraceae bacterium]|nr:PTS sugar transporter subunit IIB [Geopsychrobacteraceae bacterium]